jgi:hypothetical protein
MGADRTLTYYNMCVRSGRPEDHVIVANPAEHETVVTDDGIVLPLSELGDLVPGQRVRVTVTKPAGARRRTLRGVLAGKVRPLAYEDFEDVSRDVANESAHD